jgi:hypothetical protein
MYYIMPRHAYIFTPLICMLLYSSQLYATVPRDTLEKLKPCRMDQEQDQNTTDYEDQLQNHKPRSKLSSCSRKRSLETKLAR